MKENSGNCSNNSYCNIYHVSEKKMIKTRNFHQYINYYNNNLFMKMWG